MARHKRLDWSPRKRVIAVTLRKEGYSFRQIAAKMGGGVTASGVLKVCKRYSETGSPKTKRGKGRKVKTSPATDRWIVRMALKDRKITAACIKKNLIGSGVMISIHTIRRRLVRAGLFARRPTKKPFLSLEQRMKRVHWAKQYQHWTVEDWKQVIWSDETRISLFGSDGKTYVRRRPGEAYLPQCMTPTVKHPLSIMVWGCMSWSHVGRIQVLNGMINADRYINEVLEKKLLQSARDIFGEGRPFVFQQDGAPCHTAKKCTKWFADHGVEVMPWPGNSPDLNPIENLWSRLKKLLFGKNLSNKDQLIQATINAWFHVITPENLKKLVESMPRRCAAVIKSRGYPTRY